VLKRYHDETGAARSEFDLLPAIDLRGGRVVRLRQGDFARETTYGDDPAAVAETFVASGARWLHVVDLDGARVGEPRNADAVRRIIERVGHAAHVEVAGGLRTEAAVAQVLDGGAARAVVGTAALRDAGFARRLVDSHGSGHIAVAIDVRDGMALGEGWREGAAGVTATEAVQQLADAGVEWFEVTAISRDGLLGGPDEALLESMIALERGHVIASGGIGRVEDLGAVRDLGCRGAIVGRALYEGRFTLEAALAATQR
jgi:phosphoribosylformimino-5-aminoimidazole carboxamide ribotide isomerase